MIQITIDKDTTPRELRAYSALIQAFGATDKIAHADRPDVGIAVGPVPLPAPCIAVASAPPIARVATMDFSQMPDPDAPSPAPLAAPTGSVPTVAPTPPLAPAGVMLDVKRLPWDARIHAGGQSKNNDGSWRQKRGVDPQLVMRVEAELQHLMTLPLPAPAVPPPAPAPDVPAQQCPPPPVDGFDPDEPQDTDPARRDLGAPPATYAEFLSRVTPLTQTGELKIEQLIAAAQSLGLASLVMLASRPDLLPALWGKLAEVNRVG